MESTSFERNPQWLRGVLPLLVLALLEQGEAYGYDLTRRLEAAGLGTVKGGTLYPVLGRLETAGLVEVRWEGSQGGPARKYYRSNEAGRKELARGRSSWLEFAKRAQEVLEPHEKEEHNGTN